MNSLVKDILCQHYKDDPFLCNLLNQASVKITENTTNETLELKLEGTNHSVSPTQPITIRIEQASELIMALKEIYNIKLGPLPTLWKHHDKPKITDYKIDSMDDSDVQGPQTFEATTTTDDGIWLGLQKYEYVSFPRPIGRFPSSHSLWHHQNSSDGRLTYPHCHYLSNATLDEIQFGEQCDKWIKTNVEYIQGLTGK